MWGLFLIKPAITGRNEYYEGMLFGIESINDEFMCAANDIYIFLLEIVSLEWKNTINCMYRSEEA